jgi:hypothetical protein
MVQPHGRRGAGQRMGGWRAEGGQGPRRALLRRRLIEMRQQQLAAWRERLDEAQRRLDAERRQLERVLERDTPLEGYNALGDYSPQREAQVRRGVREALTGDDDNEDTNEEERARDESPRDESAREKRAREESEREESAREESAREESAREESQPASARRTATTRARTAATGRGDQRESTTAERRTGRSGRT